MNKASSSGSPRTSSWTLLGDNQHSVAALLDHLWLNGKVGIEEDVPREERYYVCAAADLKKITVRAIAFDFGYCLATVHFRRDALDGIHHGDMRKVGDQILAALAEAVKDKTLRYVGYVETP